MNFFRDILQGLSEYSQNSQDTCLVEHHGDLDIIFELYLMQQTIYKEVLVKSNFYVKGKLDDGAANIIKDCIFK